MTAEAELKSISNGWNNLNLRSKAFRLTIFIKNHYELLGHDLLNSLLHKFMLLLDKDVHCED